MNTPTNPETPRTSRGLLPYVMAGVVAALVVANGFLFFRLSEVDAQVGNIRQQSQRELEAFRDQSTRLVGDLRTTIESLNQQLADTRTKVAVDTAQARSTAQKHAEKLVKSLAEEQRLQREAIQEQVSAVKETTEQYGAKMSEVEGEVGAVKSEVALNRSALESDLKSVRGDLGVQSGLIATNAEELSQLKARGERNYYEFNITKQQKNTKVGGIVLTLKKTDTKRNKFNLEVLADDKRVEKKDKTLNEPVQFYVSGARTPFELVVNEIAKDRIVGYLATPKMIQARR